MNSKIIKYRMMMMTGREKSDVVDANVVVA
jgi:hypothetical protein